MYLGLDRRSLTFGGDRLRYERSPASRRRVRRNIFGRTLEQGLNEALEFARDQFQRDRRSELMLDERFREKLVLALIEIPPISFSGTLEEPDLKDLQEFRNARTNLRRLSGLLDVEKEIIDSKVGRLFDFLDERLRIIRREFRKSDTEPTDEAFDALVDWSYNKSNLEKITIVSDIVSEYNNEVERVRKRTNNYLATVNAFLRDSGKTIKFNSVGELRFSVEGEELERPINTFSSGEMQLIVILTHLYFNPEVEKANLFIIDEPELSLHVQWQEKFVDGIVDASSDTQFILATHSPSIILEKTKHCIEIIQR